jgi:hypothetical protein
MLDRNIVPYSSEHGKQFITSCIELIEHKTPRSLRVLDVGAGCGTYSNLYRSRLKGKWTGIEIWEPYVEKFQLTTKYDTLAIENAMEFLAHMATGSFDIIFIGDMLEHLTKADALIALMHVVRLLATDMHWEGLAFVSVPIGSYPQGEYEGNPYEAHLATWERADLELLRSNARCSLTHYHDEIGVAVLGKLPLSFGVSVIAKNEAKFIGRMLASLKQLAPDNVVVCDTGSSDDTVAIAKAANATVVEVAVMPWRFDLARNISLSSLPLTVDYVLTIDCDELITEGAEALAGAIFDSLSKTGKLPDVINHSFKTIWDWEGAGANRTSHYHERVHRRKGCHWVHPVHEKLVWPQGANLAWCVPFELTQKPDLTKSRASYLPLLRIAVKEDPADWKLQSFLSDETASISFEESFTALQAALALPSDQAFIKLKLGFLCERWGKAAEAKVAFEEAANLSGTREGWVHYAEHLARAGLPTEHAWKNARIITTPTTGYMRREDCWNGKLPL